MTNDRWELLEIRDQTLIDNLNLIERLIRGNPPVILVKEFYPREHCTELISRISSSQDEFVEVFNYGTAIVKTVGTFLMRYNGDLDGYFQAASRSETTFAQLFRDLPDPRELIHLLLEKILPNKQVIVPQEGGRHYSFGVIRLHEDHEGAPIHRDRINVDVPGLFVSQFDFQLSVVLNLQPSLEGGELVIYRVPWTESIEARFKNPMGLGYLPSVVDSSTERLTVSAEQGDLYILNPNYLHEIRAARGNQVRTTLGIFFAFSDDNKIVPMWS